MQVVGRELGNIGTCIAADLGNLLQALAHQGLASLGTVVSIPSEGAQEFKSLMLRARIGAGRIAVLLHLLFERIQPVRAQRFGQEPDDIVPLTMRVVRYRGPHTLSQGCAVHLGAGADVFKMLEGGLKHVFYIAATIIRARIDRGCKFHELPQQLKRRAGIFRRDFVHDHSDLCV